MSKKRDMRDFYCLRAVEFRADTDRQDESDGRTLFGYAAVFNADTEINSWEGSFVERIAPGAFKKTLREKTPVLQFDHGMDNRTGSVPIGKFERIEEDKEGLYVEARLFDNAVVEPIRQAIESEAISGMSFRFKVVRDEWRDSSGKKVQPNELWDLLWEPGDRGPIVRTIKEVKLAEAGPVVFPAYDQTSVGVRSETPDEFASLSDEERRKVVAETYIRRMPGEPVEPVDAVLEENTSITSDESPEDAVRKDTSEGHKERAIPVRATRTRRVPAKQTRKESVPNMSIDEMRARLDEIVVRMEAIADEYRDENSGEVRDVFSDEHDAEWEALQTEHSKLESAVRKAEERLEFLRTKAAKRPEYTEGPQVMRKKDKSERFNLEACRVNSGGSVERFGQLCRDNALRIAEDMKIPGVAKSKWDDVRGEVIDLIESYDTEDGVLSQRLMRTGSEEYSRAFGKAVKHLSTAGLSADEQRALASGVDASGGYMVPPELDPTIILTDSVPVSPIRALARKVKISGKTWQGITSAGVVVSRDAEAEQVSDDSPTLARLEVGVSRVAGFIPFSYEADQDWPGLQREMRRMLDRAKAKEEATSFLTGAGTGTAPEGLLTGATTTVTTVGAGAFAAADVYALETALAAEFRENAVFLGNKAQYNRVRQFDTAGGAQMWERIGAAQPAELLGYRAYEASGMASTVTTGSKILVFGDVEEAFIIIDRIGMSVRLIPDLFGPQGRPTGQSGIFAIWRNGSKVLRPEAVRVLVAG